MKNFIVVLFVSTFSFCVAQKKECVGIILSATGKTVVIKIEDDALLPAKNDSCTIAKDISGKSSPLGFEITIKSG